MLINENLCDWLNSLLQPLIVLIPGHLKDTKHVLAALKDYQWQESYIWVTADITSLYTVIPHDFAIIALKWFLHVYSSYDVTVTNFILKVTTYLLKHNFFHF